MNTLKFLAFLRGYITCIFQALVKHRYSTDIVLFTQLLRKQIYKGKTHFKSTCLVLLNCRNKRGSSAFLLTNFALSSALVRAGHRSCMHFSSGFLRVDSMKSRCRPDENPMNGRSWSGVGRHLSIPLSYQECTEKVLKRYRRATKKVLEIYQRGTKQVHAFGSFLVKLGYKLRTGSKSSLPVVCGRSVRRADVYRLKSGSLQASCAVLIGKGKYLVAREKSNVLNALKCVGQFGGYRKAFRMSLACVFLVSMFSLSAQTPRKDSGADGLTQIAPLLVGQKVPEEFWKKEYLVYNNGDTTRQTLEAFRGKLLVLDFWATWCAICLGQMKEKDQLFDRFSDQAKLIYVNPAQTKDTYYNIVHLQDRLAERSLTGNFQSIIEDDYLQKLFPNRIYPRYVWIGPRGDLIALTIALSVTEGHIKDMLNLINPKDGEN